MLLSGVWLSAIAQPHGGVDQYYCLKKAKSLSFVPLIYFETGDHWYGECRYNYEADETVSVYAGRTFKNTKAFAYSFSPMIGIAGGKFDGYSLALNSNFEYKKYSLSSQCQYVISTKDRNLNFAYIWTDACYKVFPHISIGISVQQTKTFCSNMTEGGIMIQASFRKWTVPLYFFNPPGKERYFMLGINYEWQQKQSRK